MNAIGVREKLSKIGGGGFWGGKLIRLLPMSQIRRRRLAVTEVTEFVTIIVYYEV